MIGCEGEQVCYARSDFIEEGLLGFAESRFGEKFKMLKILVSRLFMDCKTSETHSCCLEDFA